MTSPSTLLAELEDVIVNGARATRRHRATEATLAGLPLALRLLAAVPAGALVLLGIGWLAGRELVPLPVPLIAAIAVFGPILVLAILAFRAANRPIPGDLALATVDRELGLEDRLQTAAELLRIPDRTPFMQAALEDAARFTLEARERRLRLRRAALLDRRNFLWIHGAIVLLVLLSVLPRPEAATSRSTAEAPAAGSLEARSEPTPGPEERPEDPPAAPVERESTSGRAPEGGGVSPPQAAVPETEDELRASRGRTAAGRSADAAAATGASDSKGSPSNQSQASTPSARKPAKKPRQPTKPSPEPETNAPKQEDESGSTAGRGAATGSQRSPAASRWSSRDQVTSEEEQDLEDEDDVDDEIEENEARGGVQPGLRDRKPPVNRDLSIGFGNMKNPDANGRGGPGDQKKSRGVATLVLGVPIPDHVKGRPNPGRTKVTQERVRPEPEESSSVTATSRPPRQESTGPLDRSPLSPWMRRLVRDWFLSRQSTPREP